MLFRSLLNEEGEQEESPISPQSEEEKGGLWRWILFSGAVHFAIVAIFLLVPHTPFSRTISYPIYTVDLVGGEKIGGGTQVAAIKTPPVKKKKPKQVKTIPTKVERKPAPKPKKRKKTAKKKAAPGAEPVKKPIKRKKLRKQVTREPTQRALKGAISAEVIKTERTPKEGISAQAREKLILAAVERVKLRAETERAKKEKSGDLGDPSSGEGAVRPGKNGRGGGVLKGFEFLVYRNRMLHLIKEQWTWVGKISDLEVTVRFGILENGDVIGLRVVEASGDPSYDVSVLRAMRKAAPLPPPPDDYRNDFMNVELTFRPKDLKG